MPSCPRSALRPYQFVLANGPWALFRAYTGSLDYLVKQSWDEVAKLQTGACKCNQLRWRDATSVHVSAIDRGSNAFWLA